MTLRWQTSDVAADTLKEVIVLDDDSDVEETQDSRTNKSGSDDVSEDAVKEYDY